MYTFQEDYSLIRRFICIKCGNKNLVECRIANRILTPVLELKNGAPVYGETVKSGTIYQFMCAECQEPVKTDKGEIIKDYPSLIADLVNQSIDISDPDWPEAVAPFCIVDESSEEQKLRRAEDILTSLVNVPLAGLTFLDYGCGEGHCVAVARKLGARLAMGYDIRPSQFGTTDLDEARRHSPYDVVLLYDVLDHLQGEAAVDLLRRMKGLLSPNGKMYLRCHPWSARHGTHLYKRLNKAFAHLLVPDTDLPWQLPTTKVLRPHETYADWFKKAGYTIIRQETHQQGVEDYFKQKRILNALTEHWKNDQDVILSNARHTKYYSFGNSIDGLANFGNNNGTMPVGSFPANDVGLHDMHGNVWEWCSDWYDRYSSEEQIDPSGPQYGTERCLRGGSFVDGSNWLRSAQRGHAPPECSAGTIGFRIVSEDEPNSEGFDFIFVRPGKFVMGSPHDEPYREALGRDETQHDVTISKGFYLSKHQITQAMYEKVMGCNPSVYRNPDHPVECVTWYDAIRFCETLSNQMGKRYRLPTEAEWEYACRGQVGKASIEDIMSINFIDYVIA